MISGSRIVIVEDEADLADLLAYNLRRAGHEVTVAGDGQAGLRVIQQWRPDLVVLDVMLPEMSGLHVARQIRTLPRTANIPILMLTARVEEADQVAGLEVGADDYVTKPFSVKVLLARVESLLRRSRAGAPDVADRVEMSAVCADLATHELTVEGVPVRTTITEFRILVALMRGRGRILSRADLMYTAMGPDVLVTARTIDVHVAAIRRKLGAAGAMIRTVRGVGYLMEEPRDSPRAESAGR